MVDTQQWHHSRNDSKQADLCSYNTAQITLPVHLSGVLLRVHGYSSNPQLSAGSEHADSNFTWKTRAGAVREEGGGVLHSNTSVDRRSQH